MDDITTRNLEVAQRAMTHLTKRYEEQGREDTEFKPDHEPFFSCLADDAVFIPACPPDTPLVGGEHRGIDAIRKVFDETSYSTTATERNAATNPHMITRLDVMRPLEYIAQGNRVVVFGAEKVWVRGIAVGPMEYAMDLEFNDEGKICRYLHIQDLSPFYTSGAWPLPEPQHVETT